MRNDNHRWDPPAPLTRAGDGVTLTEVVGLSQMYVSGPDVLTRFADELVAWPDGIVRDHYALSIRRDRVLLVGETEFVPGVDPVSGLCVTDMSDAFAVVEMTGPGAFDRLRMGAEIRLDRPSRSVVRRVFGCDLMLCRRAVDQGFRLHVPRASAQAVVAYLCDEQKR